MIRFRMLGTVDLRDSEGRELRSVLRRPKLLALLGYLAAARPLGFHRRDTLLALLWPELDNAHARNALRQALHALREALGQDALVARGEEEVGVSDEDVWCDVRELETALAADQPENALGLYRGTLLNGLHVSEAPDFERWLDEEREYLRQRACEAAQRLIDRAAATGNVVAATRWALRLTELSPFDEAAIRRLIQLLDRAGDQAGAVRVYEDFERRIGRDLEVRPSAETRQLVDAIRARRLPNAPVAAVESDGDARATEMTATRTDAPSRAPSPRRRGMVLLAVLALTLVTGSWVLVRAYARNATGSLDPKRLVVLPFTNLGPAENEYFADGVTDEIVARLETLDRLRIIGSTTASRYKVTKTPAPEIGRELNVGYVLEGSVRWEKTPRGDFRVRVTPRLVSTADGTQLWAEVYDEPLDEIFRVQSDIAKKVAQALNITLLERQRRVVEAVQTRNVEAHDYYLRGIDFMRRGLGQFQPMAARMFEKAVESDSSFALAYAMLSRCYSRMYLTYYDHSEERITKAKWAVDKAFELEPDLPEAHQSLGTYYWIAHDDYDRALREYAITEASRPHDSNLFSARSVMEGRQGKYVEGKADIFKALELDPGSAQKNGGAGEGDDITHDFARAESLYNRAIALSPDYPQPYHYKAGLYLRRDGSTQGARAVLDEAERLGIGGAPDIAVDRVLIATFDRRYDEALARLADAPATLSDQQRFIPRPQLYAEVYGLMHRRDLARIYYDSTRRIVAQMLEKQPNDSRLHSVLGLAYAGLGRKEDAIREGRRGVELRPISRDTYQGYHRAWDLARIEVMVGEYDEAIHQLEYLVPGPGYLTPAWLRIDPTWDPLRGDPRFQKLVSSTVYHQGS